MTSIFEKIEEAVIKERTFCLGSGGQFDIEIDHVVYTVKYSKNYTNVTFCNQKTKKIYGFWLEG